MSLIVSRYKINAQGFPGGPVVKNPPAMQVPQVQSLVQEDPMYHGATNLCTTSTKPALSRDRKPPNLSPCSATTEPQEPRA